MNEEQTTSSVVEGLGPDLATDGHLMADSLLSAQEARPKPPTADDPRPAMWRNVGGPYGA